MKYNIFLIFNFLHMSDIKMVGLLHFIGNIMSGGFLGTLLVLIFMIQKKDIDEKTKSVCYNIINFNISFWIYFAISFILIFLLVGFITTPILALIWIILLVIGFIKHLAGDDYKYPMSIEFLK